ncbi:MAG: transcriptional regulator [Gammaproteobacteria bacterium]|nr:MAG: transcriptional regulator [Gammaproteobacteria bacterium]
MNDDPLKQFGSNLRNIRLNKGSSQEALADAAGLDRTYISSVERGRRNISLRAICAISIALDIQPSELLIDVVKEIKK